MILWEPSSRAKSSTSMGRLMTSIENGAGISFSDYNEFWEWSVANIELFWSYLVDHLEVNFYQRGPRVLTTHQMPGARWFPESTLNYADRALAGPGDEVVIESFSQTIAQKSLTRYELRDQVARVRCRLVEMGVESGDRVAAYLPNIAETVIVFLASASLGAIFVSCAPEFGVDAVVNRLAQVDPKILFVVDGYRFGSKVVDRVSDVAAIREALTTLETTVVIPYLDAARAASIPDSRDWSWMMQASPDSRVTELAFDHPLYILFSSGSTGPPKAIVHTHGGITIEHLKWLAIHSDVAPGDIFFWPSSTAWMTWNIGVSALLCAARIVLFDGDPTQPDLAAYWKLAGEQRATHVGVSPPLLSAARRAGIVPSEVCDLSQVRVISSGGSPLSVDLYAGFTTRSDRLDVGLCQRGTDCCTAFVGGSPLLPVRGGEITCRFLGTKVEAFNDEGRSVVGEQAELGYYRTDALHADWILG